MTDDNDEVLRISAGNTNRKPVSTNTRIKGSGHITKMVHFVDEKEQCDNIDSNKTYSSGYAYLFK